MTGYQGPIDHLRRDLRKQLDFLNWLENGLELLGPHLGSGKVSFSLHLSRLDYKPFAVVFVRLPTDLEEPEKSRPDLWLHRLHNKFDTAFQHGSVNSVGLRTIQEHLSGYVRVGDIDNIASLEWSWEGGRISVVAGWVNEVRFRINSQYLRQTAV